MNVKTLRTTTAEIETPDQGFVSAEITYKPLFLASFRKGENLSLERVQGFLSFNTHAVTLIKASGRREKQRPYDATRFSEDTNMAMMQAVIDDFMDAEVAAYERSTRVAA